ncbi:DUF3800 domain-containing protein [Planctomycetota bacterium]
MERVIHFLESERETELPIVAEARGSREDNALERVFYRIMTSGTLRKSAEIFKRYSCPLVFRNKRDNVAGIQLADLCAHPCARNILKPTQENRAYAAVIRHLYDREGVSGWKVFP